VKENDYELIELSRKTIPKRTRRIIETGKKRRKVMEFSNRKRRRKINKKKEDRL